jgi:diacylglycerol kinase (ATP)
MSKNSLGFSVRNRIHSFRYAFKGVAIMFYEEPNFRIHIIAASVTVAFGIIYEISAVEWMMISVVIGLVLVSEIFNAAVERIADFVSPDHNRIVGITKDLCSAMVLVAAMVSVVTGLIIFIPKIF